ncbi:ATP-binding protein [Kitasatospora sp. NPDC059571]|uniref:ATP-binding protein n=1 Tax=Kitasatospora sp. NPDC059571 TaxID=3346871 RepID=UPI0036AE8C89
MVTDGNADPSDSDHASPDGGLPAVCVLPATVEAVPELRRFAADLAWRWGLPQAVDDALALVVTELATNVVLHSGSPDVSLLVSRSRGAVRVVVKDSGCWRPRPARRRAAEDADALFGRGLRLVGALTGACHTFPGSTGTCVVADLVLAEAVLAEGPLPVAV